MLDHYILRRCDEAFASFDKEIDLDPNDAWTWYFRDMDLAVTDAMTKPRVLTTTQLTMVANSEEA
jgi:hypothetical protein